MIRVLAIDTQASHLIPLQEEEAVPQTEASATIFSRLVDRHHSDLLVLARALTRDENAAREIVQDAFVVAWRRLESFDRDRDFAAWMRGIVRNKWREWLRRNHRPELDASEYAEIEAAIESWQAARFQGRESLFDALEQCLERLPDRLRAAINAFYYEDDSGDEAAERLGASPAALRKRLQRAREMLRQCLESKTGKVDCDSSPSSERPSPTPLEDA